MCIRDRAGALVDTKNLPTSDYFIPYIVQKIMPVGLAGTFLAAPMAAVMSLSLIHISGSLISSLESFVRISSN